ncbi:hypothetical protein DN069_09370 [Streptacidiphilus pinicola]|uniref:Uncharacterized protein n=1 Tax=Streptacidiphilus pinicola TaxID=2219663 RepID=A0A2X0IRV6_9ACTN|nr:hypothetical protein [Streptacidiphilus pinicola]RAG85971.1 hypothetical protein DN069_09370 [Streptacidiphilus pinicola]
MAPRSSARSTRHPLRSATLAAAVLGLATGLAGAVAPAAQAADPAPVGPNQFFSGLVNGSATDPAIQMACYGPVTPGELGHPLPGQSVEVLPASAAGTADVGYTGSAADGIVANFGPTSTALPVTLGYYAVPVAIPTGLVLPCSGTGTVVFTPEPGSPTARSATLPVRYVAQP